MYQPVVQLKSGGYLVINPTEALVSIDINSGRSTREHNIEQTAFATNLEAANEIARQLRLRDMAGLIVIDFIDMEQNSHVRKVEKAMKEALKNDRARIQVGRISSFGLMEMSRQRLRTGVLEASTKPCPHCEGTGLMRTASSAGLSALRMIEDEAARGRGDKILLRAGREAAIYLLNKKRAELAEIEQPLRRLDRGRDRRELRRRADERRKLRPASDRSAAPSRADPDRRGSGGGRSAARRRGRGGGRGRGGRGRARSVAVARTTVRAVAAAAGVAADADAIAARVAKLAAEAAGGRRACRRGCRDRSRAAVASGAGRRPRRATASAAAVAASAAKCRPSADESRGRAGQLADGRTAGRRRAADRRGRSPAEPQPKPPAEPRKAPSRTVAEEADETVGSCSPPAEPAAPEAARAAEEPKPAKPARKSRAKKAKDEAPAAEPDADARPRCRRPTMTRRTMVGRRPPPRLVAAHVRVTG